jgi:hypothetical protein
MSDSAGSTDSTTVRITITGLSDIVLPPGVPFGGGGGGGGGTGGTGPSTPPGFPGILGSPVDGPAKFSFGFEIGGNLASGGGCFIDTNQTLTVSVGVDNPSLIGRAELRYVEEGQPFTNYIGILMTNQTNSDEDGLEKFSGTIPWESLSDLDGVKVWIYVIDEDGRVSESEKHSMSVKPGYSPLHENLEIFSQVEGTTFKGYAYVTNSISDSAIANVTILVNNTTFIENIYVENYNNFDFKRGTTVIPFSFDIPKTWDKVGKVVDYPVIVVGEFCNKKFESEQLLVSSFPEMIKKPIPVDSIDLLNNTLNVPIAGATTITSNDSNTEVSFTVTAPDGTCVIGQEKDCKVKGSTISMSEDHGRTVSNTKSVTLDDGQTYDVEYSGSDQIHESFTISSEEAIHGNWIITGLPGSVLYCYYEAIKQPEPSRSIIPELGLEIPRFIAIQSTLPWWIYVAVVEIIAAIIIGVVATSRQNRYLLAAEVTIDLEGGVEK